MWVQLVQLPPNPAVYQGFEVGQELCQGRTGAAPATPAAPTWHSPKQHAGTQRDTSLVVLALTRPHPGRTQQLLALFPLRSLPCQRGEPYLNFDSPGAGLSGL